MSSNPLTPNDHGSHPDAEDATQNLPDDPGKTWVPEERDGPILGQTHASPAPLAETQPLSGDDLKPTAESTQAATRADESNEPPRRFGDYELLEQIGRGGMGLVYKARDCRLDRIVALKTLKVRSAKTEQQVERFVREAKAAARLDHPNIIPCYDSGEHDGWHYLTMAYVAGKSLQDRLEQGPLEPEAAAKLLRALAGAVAHAHHQGVIHRDIKPSNVLLDKDGRPRLTDFGIAKLLDGDLFSAPAQLTLVGQVLGTPGYMAPEQSAGRRWEVGQSADIYALGGVLNVALTGQSPGSGGETLPLEIPAALQDICNRCLAHRPQDRYGSADEVISALDEYLNGLTKPAPPVVPQATEPQAQDAKRAVNISRTGLIKAGGFVAGVLVCSVLLGTWLAGLWGQAGSQDPNASALEKDSPTGAALLSIEPVQSRLDVYAKRAGVSEPVEIQKALPLEEADEIQAGVRSSRSAHAFFYLVTVDAAHSARLEHDAKPLKVANVIRSIELPLPDPGFEVNAVTQDRLAIARLETGGVLTLLLLSHRELLAESQLRDLKHVLESHKIQPEPGFGVNALERYFRIGSEVPVERAASLHSLVEKDSEAIPLGELVEALLPIVDRIEVVGFPVPEIHRPAQAEASPQRKTQP